VVFAIVHATPFPERQDVPPIVLLPPVNISLPLALHFGIIRV
jgi:hypothetical protein